MKFYKLREPSRSYVNGESNVITKEELLSWAEDVNKTDELGLKIGNNVELAIDVLDGIGQYLVKVF